MGVVGSYAPDYGSLAAANRELRAASPAITLVRPTHVEPRIDRDRARVEVLNVWWEDGFAPRRADGFVEAMRDALRAYLHFASADRLDWARHLATEKRLLLTRP